MRFWWLLPLSLLAGTAANGAPVEYTGGALTAVDGADYYLSADTEPGTITVGAGVTCTFDTQTHTLTNPTAVRRNLFVIAAGGDLTLFGGGTIEANLETEASGVFRARDVTIEGGVAGSYQSAILVFGGAWVKLERCFVQGAGTRHSVSVAATGHFEAWDCVITSSSTGNSPIKGETSAWGIVVERSTVSHTGTGTADYPIYARGDTTTVQGSILAGNGGNFLFYQPVSGVTNTLDHNGWHNFGGGLKLAMVNAVQTDDPDASGGVYGDPLFVSYPTDLHLQESSPGVDAGTGTRTTDVEGNPGVSGPEVDQGAFEFQQAGCPVPAADFSGTPLSGEAPLEVTFSDLSTESPTEWAWDFGDEGSSALQNPVHTYTTPGTYSVTLTATNACGADVETKAAYVTVSSPPGGSYGVCCADGGPGVAGLCTVTLEEDCSDWWFDDTDLCSPNPCPPNGEHVNVYAMREDGTSRLLPPGQVDRLRYFYNGGDILPAIPPELQLAWNYVVYRTTRVTPTGYIYQAASSRHNVNTYGSMAFTFALTGSQEVADSLVATLEYATTAGGWLSYLSDTPLYAASLVWDQLEDSVRSDLLQIWFDMWGEQPGEGGCGSDGWGIGLDPKESGIYNLQANWAYWPSLWALVCWGQDLTPEHSRIASVLDDAWVRFHGGYFCPWDLTGNGVYDWLDTFFPTWDEDYSKGPGYGSKLMGDGLLNWASVMWTSGLSDEPKERTRAYWEDGAAVATWGRLMMPVEPLHLVNAWINSSGIGERHLAEAAYCLQFHRSAWGTFGAVVAPMWNQYKNTYYWGQSLLLTPPDSLTTPQDLEELPLVEFRGTEGTAPRRAGHKDWFDQVIGRFGPDPWALRDANTGAWEIEGGMIQADSWVDGKSLALTIEMDGTGFKRMGLYGDGSPGQYPRFLNSAWASPTIVVLNTDSPNVDETYEAAGPWQVYNSRSDHSDRAEPPSDWLGPNQAKWEKGNITTVGMAELGDLSVTYVEGYIPDHAYVDDTWGVQSQTRRMFALTPNRKVGKALWIVRDKVVLDPEKVSSGEAIFSNFPVIHRPAVQGTITTTWPVPGLSTPILDWGDVDYVSVTRDTTTGWYNQTAIHEWSHHGRWTPLYKQPGDYLREIWGRGLWIWMYSDADDPVGSGEALPDLPLEVAKRFTSEEGGGGRFEWHAANASDSADLFWVYEAHAEDDEPVYTWGVPTEISSADAKGAVVDSVVAVILDNPETGGPWSISWTGTETDVVIGRVPTGLWTMAGRTAAAVDSILIFQDLDGGSYILESAGGDPTGACCFSDGSCTIATEAGCVGSWQGAGTTCSPNPCPQPTGACCAASGTCTVTTEAGCSGTWQGAFTGCSPNPCPQPPTGACCFSDGSCSIETQSNCLSGGGVYQGDGTACSPNPCPQPTGACCFSDGSCSLLTEELCFDGFGEFQGDGEPCDPNPCPQPATGACCFSDGSCLVETEADCSAGGGVYQGNGDSCSPNPCPQPTGACCFSDGSCLVETEADCLVAEGTYQGDGELCSPNPCPQPPTGACCFSDGSCSLLTAAACSGSSGTYQGDGTTCSPNPCPEPTGACCLLETCTIETLEDCTGGGRYYYGDGTTCDPSPCPRHGACCYGDGFCAFLPIGTCESVLQGSWLGDDTTCSPNPCPSSGACCFDLGVCVVAPTSSNCADQGGTFQGAGEPCDPNPCPLDPGPTGACCVGAVCSITTVLDCGGEWLGASTTCSPDPCVLPVHSGTTFATYHQADWCVSMESPGSGPLVDFLDVERTSAGIVAAGLLQFGEDLSLPAPPEAVLIGAELLATPTSVDGTLEVKAWPIIAGPVWYSISDVSPGRLWRRRENGEEGFTITYWGEPFADEAEVDRPTAWMYDREDWSEGEEAVVAAGVQFREWVEGILAAMPGGEGSLLLSSSVGASGRVELDCSTVTLKLTWASGPPATDLRRRKMLEDDEGDHR